MPLDLASDDSLGPANQYVQLRSSPTGMRNGWEGDQQAGKKYIVSIVWFRRSFGVLDGSGPAVYFVCNCVFRGDKVCLCIITLS